MTSGTTRPKAQAENTPLELLSLRVIHSAGALRAIARVRIGPVAIDHIKLLQADNGDYWLGALQVPSRRNADGSGAGWRTVIDVLDRGLWADLREMIIGVYAERAAAAGGGHD
jgi:hypothetical protein